MIDCRLELLDCIVTPPPVVGPDCLGAYDECLAQGRSPDGCAEALALCQSPPMDTAAPPVDTGDRCQPLLSGCLAAGLDPVWCEDVADACRTSDPGEPCVAELEVCLLEPDPAVCPLRWEGCRAGGDTGTTCREVHVDCLAATGLTDACALVLAACAGQDLDPALACATVGAICLRDAWATDCMQAEADCNLPSACQDTLVTCLATGEPPEGCAAGWLSCRP